MGDLVLATRWVHDLLVLKSRANEELAARVNDLFARIGKTKMQYLLEDEIRALGDHCVLPLRSYLHSPDSRRDPRKRVLAARILADVTQPWFVPEFIELLADEDGEVRYYAATGLERLTGRAFDESADQWRTEPWDSLEAERERWRAWWKKHRYRYSSGPVRPPTRRLKARLK